MSLFGRIERRAATLLSPASWDDEFPGWGGLRTHSGKRINRHSAVRMITVYSCVGLVADGIGSLPVDLYRRKSGGVRQNITDAAPAWIRQPNPFQTPFDFWHRVVTSLLLDGNAFIATIRNDAGFVVALYCLDPAQVGINEGVHGENTYTLGGETFDRSQILHIAAFTLGACSRGLSPIDIAREAIGLGLTAEEFGARFFSQGSTMAGVIEHPGTPKPGEARLLREMFKKNHAGLKKSHSVGILTGGAAFKPISIDPERAQFLETRRFQKSEIALLYRVPAYMVDPTVTSTWGSGIEEQNQWFIQQTLMPWIVRLEQAVSFFLLPGPQFVKFNVDARLRPKTQERYESYSKAIDAGFMNVDEARALEDLPPLPGGKGKAYYRPLNFAPIGSPTKPAKNAQAPPEPDDNPAGGSTT